MNSPRHRELIQAKDWETISAEGDGSCAFNAFILGLKHNIDLLETKNADRQYKDFLAEYAALTKRAATWSSFAAHLKSATTKDEIIALQKQLAPLFRKFSIDRLSKQKGLQGQTHKETLFTAVKTEFRNQVLAALGQPISQSYFTQDDICRRLHAVTTKFDAIKQECKGKFGTQPDLDTAIERYQENELKKWWNETGYTASLKELELSGWGGDLELAPLAEYFGVQLDVHRPRGDDTFVHTIHYDYGCFDRNDVKLSEDTLSHLIKLEIVEKVTENIYRWKKIFEQAELERLLARVPNHEVIEIYFMGLKAPADKPDKVKGQEISEDDQAFLSNETIAALKSRPGVLKETAGKLTFALGETETLDRLSETPNKDAVLRVWCETQRPRVLPVITLVNQSAAHWDLRVHKAPKLSAEVELKSPVAPATPQEDSKAAEKKVSPPVWRQETYIPSVEKLTGVNKWENILKEVAKKAEGKQLKQAVSINIDDEKKSFEIAPHAGMKSVNYTFTSDPESRDHSKNITADVSEDAQIKLDRILAEKIQQEEYDRWKRLKR